MVNLLIKGEIYLMIYEILTFKQRQDLLKI